MKSIALIPARSGSKRLPDKNILPLAGHPLIAYTIEAAQQSGIFADIVVSTDSDRYAEIAAYYGAKVIKRPTQYATDTSPDIEWQTHALAAIRGDHELAFILRPTSPFRLPDTIVRASRLYKIGRWLKAVEPVTQHPYKMWVVNHEDSTMRAFHFGSEHAQPTQVFPRVYVQNASLEIRRTYDIVQNVNNMFQPFFTIKHEGYDINDCRDWAYAEHIVSHSLAELPKITRKPYETAI
jgi:CMP-N-acetylneuraminic acid synthetase